MRYSQSNIMKKLKDIILNIKPNLTNEILEDSNIVDDLGFSSFDIFILIHEMEKEFKIEFTEDNIKNNWNIKNLIELILSTKAKNKKKN